MPTHHTRNKTAAETNPSFGGVKTGNPQLGGTVPAAIPEKGPHHADHKGDRPAHDGGDPAHAPLHDKSQHE